MTTSRNVEACGTAAGFARALGRAPAVVVHVRALAVPSMFPSDVRDAADGVPYDVLLAVAPPEVVHACGVTAAGLGDTLVFAGGRLVGHLDRSLPDVAKRVAGLLRASLSPWLGRTGAEQWDEDGPDDADPFAVLGLPRTASFEEVHAAWRARLGEYHPDRFERAGEKIRRVAAAETARLNAAFREIAERYGRYLPS